MQKSLFTCLILPAIATALTGFALHADDKIIINLVINNKPVRFIYDTGADHSLLFRRSAERLGLKIIPNKDNTSPAPGQVNADRTEECTLAFAGKSQKLSLFVIDSPYAIRENVDGALSWKDLVAADNQVTLIDWGKHTIASIPLPANILEWTKWKIVKKLPVLIFECPDGEKIGIDTGDSRGVLLNVKRWKRWRAERDKQPATLDASLFPAEGLVVTEILRARKISVGSFTLNDVPVGVSELPPGTKFGNFDAIIGLFALAQIKLILDPTSGVLYTLPDTDPPAQFEYNRLGAVFAPKDSEKSTDLIAHVVEGSPAYDVGIRNEDVLVKIGDLDVTKWRTDPQVRPLSRFWNQASGTAIKLSLIRNGQPYEVTVTLKDLMPVD